MRDKPLKIVFVADLKVPSASGRQRLWALQQCGAEVTVLDKQNYPSALGRWGGHVARLLSRPRLMKNSAKLERDLLALCEKVQPDILWYEWPKEIRPPVLKAIKKLPHAPLLISFQDDNPWGTRHGDRWMWNDYFKVAKEFAIHLVKRPQDIVNLGKVGASGCRMWVHGVYTPLFHPAADGAEKKYPVSFVGNCMDKRAQFVGRLLEKGIPIHVFGPRWDQRSDLPKQYPANFHPAVHGEPYAEVLQQSLISLGLISESNEDEWSMRTFEVPGCAGLLLGERTPSHTRWFQEGRDAEYFSTEDECAEKLDRLLATPVECKTMGRNAYETCMSNKWLLENRMQTFLDELTLPRR